MSQTARVYRIEMLIKSRGCVSFRELQDELEVSPATLKRDLAYLRDRLGAPIEYDRDSNGYRLAAPSRGPRHELPGLWFSERELYSLLMTHQLLSGLDGAGTLGRHLQPLLERVHGLLGAGGGGDEADARAMVRRVRILSPARRSVPPRVFELVGEALFRRRRLALRYFSRRRDARSERSISPQRLVHHRSTWYVDAWCHASDGLRRFALDAIESASLCEDRAHEVPIRQVEQAMDGGYGIYAAADARWATLAFQPRAARWIHREEWHPAQRGRWLPDGRWQLELPYADEGELAMDLMRHGADVAVIEPASLREALARRHAEALAVHGAA